MDENNRNFILAIILSIGVLFAWQYFFVPKPHPAGEELNRRSSSSRPNRVRRNRKAARPPPAARRSQAPPRRDDDPRGGSGAESRIAIDTPSLKGSIALKGGRIDDLTLKDYRETVEPYEPASRAAVARRRPACLLHRAWLCRRGRQRRRPCPGPTRCGQAQSGATLTPQSPVTLSFDNGNGLKFTRTISLDDKYMFTIDDQVTNTGVGARYALSLRARLAP